MKVVYNIASGEDLGRFLFDARNELGLSLSAFAEKAGVSKGYLSKLESGQGNPSFQMTLKLLDALNCRIALAPKEVYIVGKLQGRVVVPKKGWYSNE